MQLVVRWLHADGKIDAAQFSVALEHDAELVFGIGSLFSGVEDERQIACERGHIHGFGEPDHHRETTLHVARTSAVAPITHDSRGAVLGAHRVEMADERNVRPASPAHDGYDDRVTVPSHGRGYLELGKASLNGVAKRAFLPDGGRDAAEPKKCVGEQ